MYIPCIVDEVKKFFNIEKNGTHIIRYKSKLYILYRSYIKGLTLYLEQPYSLLNFDEKKKIYNDVKRLMIYYSLWGCKIKYNDIYYRIDGKIIIDECYSYNYNREGLALMTSHIEKDFDLSNSDDYISFMLGKDAFHDSSIYLHELKELIDSCISIIDKKCIYLSSILTYKISCLIEGIDESKIKWKNESTYIDSDSTDYYSAKSSQSWELWSSTTNTLSGKEKEEKVSTSEESVVLEELMISTNSTDLRE